MQTRCIVGLSNSVIPCLILSPFLSKNLALSYFIKGDVAEDHGFALKPWEEIKLEELNTIEEGGLTVAMGTLNFKPFDTEEMTMVAFTFLLIDVGDSLKIKAHHSSPIS